jgi:hypothetical protein
VIFAIRTRRVLFFRSHPSIPLVLAALGVVAVGAMLPSTPLAHTLGFQALPGDFFIALAALALAYLVLIELGKRAFYSAVPVHGAPDKRRLDDARPPPTSPRRPPRPCAGCLLRCEHTACGADQGAGIWPHSPCARRRVGDVESILHVDVLAHVVLDER